MKLEEKLNMKVKSRGLIRFLEKLDATILTPREIIAKFKKRYRKEEPHLEIERDIYKIYNTLKELDYAVDIKDFTKPFLSLESLEDGVIPQYDFGEDIVAAKAIGDGKRLHARMWKSKTQNGEKCYRVEAHTEIYPTTGKLNYPKTLWQWLTRASLHIRDPKADYNKGAQMLLNEIMGYIEVYNIQTLIKA